MLNDLGKQLVKIHLKEAERNRINMIKLIEDIKPEDVDRVMYQEYQSVLRELKKMTDDDFKLIAIQLQYFEEEI